MVVMLALPAGVFAGARLQDEGSGTISLNRVGNVPEQASGTAKFKVTSSDDGFYKVKLNLDVKNLPEKAGNVFAVLLTDSSENFANPIGVFQTDSDGDGDLTVTTKIVSFVPYDQIQVTSVPKNSDDPKSDSNVVLQGALD